MKIKVCKKSQRKNQNKIESKVIQKQGKKEFLIRPS